MTFYVSCQIHCNDRRFQIVVLLYMQAGKPRDVAERITMAAWMLCGFCCNTIPRVCPCQLGGCSERCAHQKTQVKWRKHVAVWSRTNGGKNERNEISEQLSPQSNIADQNWRSDTCCLGWIFFNRWHVNVCKLFVANLDHKKIFTRNAIVVVL